MCFEICETERSFAVMYDVHAHVMILYVFYVLTFATMYEFVRTY